MSATYTFLDNRASHWQRRRVVWTADGSIGSRSRDAQPFPNECWSSVSQMTSAVAP